MPLTRYFLFLLLVGCRLAGNAQATLTKLGSTPIPTYGTALAVEGTTAYVLTATGGTQRLHTYDVRTPATPQLLATIQLSTAGLPIRHAIVHQGTLYVSTFPSLSSLPHPVYVLAIDVRNPAAPAVRASLYQMGGDDFSLAAAGNYVYGVFEASSAVQVYDTNLNYVRSVPLPYSLSSIIGLNIVGTTAYVQYASSTYATLDLTAPDKPVTSAGTIPGTISATNGTLGYGLAQPAYTGSVPTNTLRFYTLSNPLQPALLRTVAGSFGTQLAAGTQCVFTIGATSPYLAVAASSSEPLRGYYIPSSGGAPIVATDPASQGANALAVAANVAYVLTDSNLSIYAFPATVLATHAAAAPVALSFYPNPASGTVHLPPLAPGGSVAVYDATGRACLQTTLPANGMLDISPLPAGLYQVRAGAATGKLTVE